MRRVFRLTLVSAIVGALSLGTSWGGAVLTPAPDVALDIPATQSRVAPPAHLLAQAPTPSPVPVPTLPPGDAPPLRDGQVLAGAAKISIVPQPDESKGQVWQKQGCRIVGDDYQRALTHAGDLRNTWPEDPNCIYMGGYGIGPSNPMVSVDQDYGLWVRSVALGDGTDTVVLTIIDATSYFGRYNKLCLGCGAFDLAEELGAELGIAPSGFFIASTHSHTAPDLIGGWGGVPQWYMDQVAEAIRTSIRTAVQAMRPAVLENGEVIARQFNGERRDFYRSAEDPALGWFRAIEAATGETVATVGSYAAHPVTVSAGKGVGDADYPGVFATRVEERFGGTGLFFMTGLGNMSPRGDKLRMGNGLADLVPQAGDGTPVDGTDVRSAQTAWDQPITNSGLTALGAPGFFDRPFTAGPATVTAGKDASRPCRSAAEMSVRTAVSAAKVGNLTITGAPGETFSNLATTIKERNPEAVSLPLAQVNDGLGYILQSFETDHAGRQVVGFVGKVDEGPVRQGLAEYEDAYSLDACFGDMVLESTVALLGQLR